MNERIRELSEQAEKYADDNFRGEPTWSEAFESKFAELIVWECCKICETIGREARKQWKAKYNPHDDGRSDGAWECEEQIKQHFGWRD